MFVKNLFKQVQGGNNISKIYEGDHLQYCKLTLGKIREIEKNKCIEFPELDSGNR